MSDCRPISMHSRCRVLVLQYMRIYQTCNRPVHYLFRFADSPVVCSRDRLAWSHQWFDKRSVSHRGGPYSDSTSTSRDHRILTTRSGEGHSVLASFLMYCLTP